MINEKIKTLLINNRLDNDENPILIMTLVSGYKIGISTQTIYMHNPLKNKNGCKIMDKTILKENKNNIDINNYIEFIGFEKFQDVELFSLIVGGEFKVIKTLLSIPKSKIVSIEPLYMSQSIMATRNNSSKNEIKIITKK